MSISLLEDKEIIFLERNKENRIIINFSKEAMNDFIKEHTVTHSTGRKKFKKEFHNALSEKLQSQNVKCWLKNVWNWLSNSDNLKWSSKYTCVNRECQNRFSANINHAFNDPSFIRVVLSYQSFETHNDYVKCPTKCTGKDREKTALELMAYGNSNVKTANIIYNISSRKKKPIDDHILKQIKYEEKHKYRYYIYNNLFIPKIIYNNK